MATDRLPFMYLPLYAYVVNLTLQEYVQWTIKQGRVAKNIQLKIHSISCLTLE
jgi:hypothetical protein